MIRLILAIALLILSLPAQAFNAATGTGNTPLIVFPTGQKRTLSIVYAPASSINGTIYDVYDFIPTSGDSNAANYLNNNGTVVYSPPFPTTPTPTNPALSQNDQNPVIRYEAALLLLGIPVTGVQGANPNDPTWNVTFSPSITQAQNAQAQSIASNFNWTIYPNPNPSGFLAAVTADSTFPGSALLDLATFEATISATTYQLLPKLQGLWTALKARDNVTGGPLFGNCTDGVPITTKIETYAAQFNMPLVAQ